MKLEGEEAAGYSVPVAVMIDPTVTMSSLNQVRTTAVSRLGNDVVVSWGLLKANERRIRPYYDPGDETGLLLLSSTYLPPTETSYTVPAQSIATSCGTLLVAQEEVGESDLLPGAGGLLPPGGGAVDIGMNPPCTDPPDPPEPPNPSPDGPVFADQFHHRDHLGSLRVVTDAAGWTETRSDYYPFGMEIVVGAGEPGTSRRMFTGHERDRETGLDYMLARYYSGGLASFLSVDPVRTVHDRATSPGALNLFVYAQNNPLKYIDPNGKDSFLVARPLGSDPDSIFVHMFVVTHAAAPGAPGQVFSFGLTDQGTMGRVDDNTQNQFSGGTSKDDQAAWARAADDPNVTVVKIPAGDDAVAALASSVMENQDYAALGLNFGLNSNSAAVAIADEAAGKDVPLPDPNRIAPGQENADYVQFDTNGDGNPEERGYQSPPPPPVGRDE